MTFIKRNWIKMLVCILYGILIIIIYNISNENWTMLINYCNSTFIAGFSLICIGCLSIINNVGGFNLFSYMFAKRNEKGVKEDYYTYTLKNKEKREKREKPYYTYFIIGAVLIAISAILLFTINKSKWWIKRLPKEKNEKISCKSKKNVYT